MVILAPQRVHVDVNPNVSLPLTRLQNELDQFCLVTKIQTHCTRIVPYYANRKSPTGLPRDSPLTGFGEVWPPISPFSEDCSQLITYHPRFKLRILNVISCRFAEEERPTGIFSSPYC